MKSNTQKQAEYRARMRDKGYVLVRGWVPKKHQDRAKKYLERLAKDD